MSDLAAGRTLFTWQAECGLDPGPMAECPWCGTGICSNRGPADSDHNTHVRFRCPLCGWFASRHVFLMKTTGIYAGSYRWGLLRSFEPAPERLSISSLAVELAARFPAPVVAHWSAIAQFVSGFCREAGIDTVSRHQTADDSAQIQVIRHGDELRLLECTRVHSQPLRCALPGLLAGLAIDWQAQATQLITLPDPDQATALKTADLSSHGHTLPLATATTLLTHLDCNTTDLDPLGTLDAERREAINSTNRHLAG